MGEEAGEARNHGFAGFALQYATLLLQWMKPKLRQTSPTITTSHRQGRRIGAALRKFCHEVLDTFIAAGSEIRLGKTKCTNFLQ